jgi:hypothetical protein
VFCLRFSHRPQEVSHQALAVFDLEIDSDFHLGSVD